MLEKFELKIIDEQTAGAKNCLEKNCDTSAAKVQFLF